MPIIGIDYEKCINCKLCVIECRRRYIEDKEQNKIIFQDPDGSCILCGHCIAVCPENAILYEGFGDEPYTFTGIKNLETIAPYDTLYNFFRGHRSIRHYKKEKVPDDVLRKVFNAMECAPTGANLRSEKYVILSDQEKIKTLSDAVMEELIKSPALGSSVSETFNINKKYYDSLIYFDAPHVIIIYGPADVMIENINIGIIATYGRLAAQALGLGTCWNGWTIMAFENNRKLLKLAGIRGRSWGVFTIGYPDVIFQRCPPRSQKRVKGLKK